MSPPAEKATFLGFVKVLLYFSYSHVPPQGTREALCCPFLEPCVIFFSFPLCFSSLILMTVLR